jgi:spore coat protein A, manganese oxidase
MAESLRSTRIAVVSLAVGCALSTVLAPAPARGQGLLDPMGLTKYVDPLPNPMGNVIAPSGTLNGSPLYDVSISQFTQQLHRDLPATTVWGYGGTYPGPTFVVNSGETIQVKWTNNLVDGSGAPLPHLLPYDSTLPGAMEAESRVVTHLHGGITESASDGLPERWFTPDPAAPANGTGGPAGNSFTTTYTNDQRASTLWYHDHAMGATRLNVYAGLAGFYLVRDPNELSLNLPSGAYEIPLVLQDRSFYNDGQLFYPAGPGDVSDPGGGDPLAGLPAGFSGDASIVPNFMGNTNLVNGKIWPYLEVEPRKYRFRMLNGANSRFYNLVLDGGAAGTVPFHQIGTDAGLLATSVDRNQVAMGPADRADVIVDFSQFNPGDQIVMKNLGPDGPAGLDGGGAANPSTTGQVMQFKIKALAAPDTSVLPLHPATVARYSEADAQVIRQLTLVEDTDEFGRPMMMLDGKLFSDAVTEVSQLGALEIWELQNFTRDAHPIHLHLAHMQMLDRTNRQTGALPVEDYELGWEDTIVVNPRENVRVFVEFEQYTGAYVWHCHILEHEDHDMMRPSLVVPEPGVAGLAMFGALLLGMRRRR